MISGPPLVGIDPVRLAIHHDVGMGVNARHADLEGDDLAAGDIVIFHEIVTSRIDLATKV
jgi:hypothetical protein